MKKDITTKDTIKTITQDIAKYILELDVQDIIFVDKELQRIEKREADIVTLCKVNGQKAILHLEIQNDNDKTMDRRMLRYYTDIKLRFDNIKIYQYMIYIGKAKLSMKDSIIEENINYRYNIIDMHKIDCEKFLVMDNPDALVLSILCDFKDKNEIDILSYILRRLEEFTQDNEHLHSKYMLILETLSGNRDLQKKLKEAEEMLRTTKLEDLPSYQIALERGIINTAIIMIQEFNLSIEQVAKRLNISIDELQKHINNKKIKR
jgi:predicted transposase YdaD